MGSCIALAYTDGNMHVVTPDLDHGSPGAPSLDELYNAEIRRLIGLGSAMMGDPSSGEDLAHDAFLLLLRRIKRQPGYLRSPGWPLLRTILVRLAVQRRRSLAREARRMAKLWEPKDSVSWDPDPALIDWGAAVRQLPTRMRACVVLFYGEDLSTAQVAETLGCSPRTVENQLHQARLRLSAALRADPTRGDGQ